jgi:hypothetical protein
VDLRAGLDDVEKRKFLTLPGLELRPFGGPARSQSLYRLSYPGWDRRSRSKKKKVKLHEHVWESGGIAPSFLTSALVGGEWSASRPGRFTLDTHWKEACVGPGVGLDAAQWRKKYLAPAGNRIPAVQAVSFSILTELSRDTLSIYEEARGVFVN